MSLNTCKLNWTEPSFWQDVEAGNVLRLLAAGGGIWQRNEVGVTPLHMASRWGDIEIVRALLDAGACVQSLDDMGVSSLHYAVNRNEVGVVQALLEAGADANLQSSKRANSALHLAAKRGDEEIVQALLNAGANTELRQKIKHITPLHFAAIWGNIGCIRALLDAGADAGAKDACGMTPLKYASESARALLEETELGTLKTIDENRNIMLFWDNAPPTEISAAVEKWRNVCPAWNVTFFNEQTACEFLQERFGREIVRLFLRCAIPAMKSDFFRVFWAISEGGIYTDVSLIPKREPFFFDPEKDITVVTHATSQTLNNNIFYSKKDTRELKLVAHEIIKSISLERIPYIALATGPAAWARALGQKETSTMAILGPNDLYQFVQVTEHSRKLKKSDMHWSRQQYRTSIYGEAS